jgi:hypothetical protein
MEIFLITFPGKTKKVYVGKAHDAEAAHTNMQVSSRKGGNKKIDGALRYYAGHSKVIVLFKDVPAGNTANALEWIAMVHYKSWGEYGYNETLEEIPKEDAIAMTMWQDKYGSIGKYEKPKPKASRYNPRARERRLNKRGIDKK